MIKFNSILKFIIKSVAIYINLNVYSFISISVWVFGVETLVVALVLIKCCWVAKGVKKLFYQRDIFVFLISDFVLTVIVITDCNPS